MRCCPFEMTSPYDYTKGSPHLQALVLTVLSINLSTTSSCGASIGCLLIMTRRTSELADTLGVVLGVAVDLAD